MPNVDELRAAGCGINARLGATLLIRRLGIGFAVVVAGALGSAPVPSSAVGASALPKVVACPGLMRPAFKPSSFILACADANQFVAHIKWTKWTSTSAQGHGTLKTNQCIPDCAAGSFVSARTTITVSKPVRTSEGMLFSVVEVPGATSTGGRAPPRKLILPKSGNQ